MRVRSFTTSLIVTTVAALLIASGASAQTSGGFVSGPLTWAPTIQLRDAGVDSNVFNEPDNPRDDRTGSVVSQVDSQLKLPYLQLSTHGGAEYDYFEQYKSQRATNGLVNSRVVIPLSRFQPTAFGAWTHAKERSSSELDVRAPRTDHAFGGGFSADVATRFAVTAELDRFVTRYERGETFRGVEIASQLNHQSTTLTTGARVTVTPLTTLFIEGGAGRDQFELKPALDTDNVRGDLGFDFSPDAVISGRANIGYHMMQPRHASNEPGGALRFSGITSSVSLNYTLLGRTRFSPRFARDTNYSASDVTPYYVSTVRGLDILQVLFGPLDVLVHGSQETLEYPITPLAPSRQDHVNNYGGGLSIRIANQGRIGVTYDAIERRSTGGSLFTYSRRHIYTSVTYGF
jgi:hypothetical protein